MQELNGIVESVLFQAPENTFCVFKINEQAQGLTCIVYKGIAPYIGEQITLQGEWVEHAKFGKQFQAKSLTIIPPSSKEGMERFLASGIIKGIGKAMAKRIVDHFGEETLQIMNAASMRLTEVSGIGAKKAQDIIQSYAEIAEMRELMIFLESYGISSSYAPKLQSNYGSQAINKLRDNPYALASEVHGIGFKTADRIALSMGFEVDSPLRLRAGIEFAVGKIATLGHTCISLQALTDQTAKMLQAEPEYVYNLLEDLLEKKRLRSEEFQNTQLVYPEYLYQAECIVARRLLRLKDQARAVGKIDVEAIIGDWESKEAIKLADIQKQAIQSTVQHGVLVLTGGPGTGKTTIIRGIIKVLEKAGCEILLAAPTGRAARRLAESAGREAKTIHRLLEYNPAEGRFAFARNEYQPLEADVVIVDEASMLDIVLASYLLRALATGCRLVLVGDIDQLPSVGAGNVLGDIIRSESMPVIRLQEVFRQAEQSSIVVNAHKINQGKLPDLNKNADFVFRELAEEQAVADLIAQTYLEKLNTHGQQELQVLAPMHKQVCGVQNLNKILQQLVNPASEEKEEINTVKYVFREGDKVMQIKNNYEKDVFNGDIGIITSIAGQVSVRFPEKGGADSVVYAKGELDELELAYAISVHKAQGSEYKCVLLPLVLGHYIMLQRNLLYTAITRAKSEVFLAGKLQALKAAVANNKTHLRYSLLKERLQGVLPCS